MPKKVRLGARWASVVWERAINGSACYRYALTGPERTSYALSSCTRPAHPPTLARLKRTEVEVEFAKGTPASQAR